MFLKVKGNPKYLYALLDDETRFWIAKEVAGDKMTAVVCMSLGGYMVKDMLHSFSLQPNIFLSGKSSTIG
jgi:hypothetical protein